MLTSLPDTSNLHLLPTLTSSGSLSSRIETVLMEAIQTGTLRSGERLLVDDVASHFGVSKIPVREAFKALEVAGWLEAQPRRGTFVKRLSAKSLNATFEIRKLIEPHCAALAALRRTSEHLDQLKKQIELGRLAVLSGDRLNISKSNREFHNTIAQATDNEFMINIVSDIQQRLRRYFISINWHERNTTTEQHLEIFQAIYDKNDSLAKELTLQHIEQTEILAKNSLKIEENQ